MAPPRTPRTLRLFVSYASEDRDCLEKIIEPLKVRFASSKNYEPQFWTDQDIPLGENWMEQIQKALDSCDFGLLLISPAFLASAFIDRHELPRFVPSRGGSTRIKPKIGRAHV